MKILLISDRKERLEGVGILLADFVSAGHSLQTMVAPLSAIAAIISSPPDVLLIDGLCQSEEDFSAIEEITRSHSTTAVLLISENKTPEYLLRAMRAGVREVVPVAGDDAALKKTLDRIVSRIRGQVVGEPGKVIVFVASKGGSGATFLAANFAYAIASLRKPRVALIDLNLQFGDASLFVMEQRPAHTLRDIVVGIDRLDTDLLDSCMEEVLPNLHVLAAPEEPEDSVNVRSSQIERLLDFAARRFDYVVVDVDHAFNSVSLCALDKADVIYVILQMCLPFIRDARRMLNVLRTLGYVAPKVDLIVNRYEEDEQLSLGDVEKAVGARIEWLVPNSYKNVKASVDRGIPILKLAPKDPVSRKLGEMVNRLLPQEERAHGWLSGLFGAGHRE